MLFEKKKEEKKLSIETPMDRRKFVRIRNIITVLCAGEQSGKFTLYTDNISQGGIKGFTQTDVTEGQTIELIMLLVSVHTRLDIKGKIVWAKKINQHQCEIGIEFINIKEEDRKKLKDYIEAHQKENNEI